MGQSRTGFWHVNSVLEESLPLVSVARKRPHLSFVVWIALVQQTIPATPPGFSHLTGPLRRASHVDVDAFHPSSDRPPFHQRSPIQENLQIPTPSHSSPQEPAAEQRSISGPGGTLSSQRSGQQPRAERGQPHEQKQSSWRRCRPDSPRFGPAERRPSHPQASASAASGILAGMVKQKEVIALLKTALSSTGRYHFTLQVSCVLLLLPMLNRSLRLGQASIPLCNPRMEIVTGADCFCRAVRWNRENLSTRGRERRSRSKRMTHRTCRCYTSSHSMSAVTGSIGTVPKIHRRAFAVPRPRLHKRSGASLESVRLRGDQR